MSRTRNTLKKIEGKARKLAQEEEKKKMEEIKKEEEMAVYWSIGAKDLSKENEKEQKRLEKIAKKADAKIAYEKEMNEL